MHVAVNGVKLFVDVLSRNIRVSGPLATERPAIVALHGGPFDHQAILPFVEPLTDLAQVVVFDQRGCGRSDAGDPALWTIEQWGDDVAGLCDALGIERPIVIGHSFGGFVSQAFATRHPDRAAGVGLLCTGPRLDKDTSREGFRRQGGDAAAAAFDAFAADPGPASIGPFVQTCLPLYTVKRTLDGDMMARSRVNPELQFGFFRRYFAQSFDFRPDLPKVTSPTLVLGCSEDPILPPQLQDEIEAGLTNAAVTRVRLEKSGHFPTVDVPEAYAQAVRTWVQSLPA